MKSIDQVGLVDRHQLESFLDRRQIRGEQGRRIVAIAGGPQFAARVGIIFDLLGHGSFAIPTSSPRPLLCKLVEDHTKWPEGLPWTSRIKALRITSTETPYWRAILATTAASLAMIPACEPTL
jgi:hypothetical protein